MQRRLSPAIATVAATAQRLGSLSERVSRTSALLRTRVDMAAELQNQQLLAKLTRLVAPQAPQFVKAKNQNSAQNARHLQCDEQ